MVSEDPIFAHVAQRLTLLRQRSAQASSYARRGDTRYESPQARTASPGPGGDPGQSSSTAGVSRGRPLSQEEESDLLNDGYAGHGSEE